VQHKDNWDKLIVALDVVEEARIKEIVNALQPRAVKFKIGLIAFSRMGPAIVRWIHERGSQVFLDFKLYDIPHTMSETAKSFVELGIWAYTVHARAGETALRTVKEEVTRHAQQLGKRAPLAIGVTELTSQDASVDNVVALARTAKKSQLDGVVCSVWEARRIKEELGLMTITPGIRPRAGQDDQKRVATFKDVLENNVDYCVVGRPIIEKSDCLKAAEDILSV